MKRTRLLRWLTVLSIGATILINMLANTLPINGLNTGEISDRFDIYFVPAGYVFSIWFIIYVGLIALGVYLVLPADWDNERLDRILGWLMLSSAANIAWIFCWHYLLFQLSLVAMVILLVSLIMAYIRLEIGKTPAGPGEFWLVRVPVSVYLGWISVATIANVTQVLYINEWGGWGISDAAWAAIMLFVAAGLGWVMVLTRRDIPYLLVLIWALLGIAFKHQSTQLVSGSAWAAVGLCALALFVSMTRRLRKNPT